jgi:hypothetical protein
MNDVNIHSKSDLATLLILTIIILLLEPLAVII